MNAAILATPTKADPHAGHGVVLFDGQCPLCRRSVEILKKLDWLGRLAYQDCRDEAHWPPSDQPLEMTRLLEEMHVVTASRRRAFAGYAAFRWIAWRIPAAWPIAPLLYIPGVPWLGNKAYLWVAKRRMHLVPCHDGVCQLPTRR
jgi:predicted DCC family thiol-disulfide oxidoreductase YuxK